MWELKEAERKLRLQDNEELTLRHTSPDRTHHFLQLRGSEHVLCIQKSVFCDLSLLLTTCVDLGQVNFATVLQFFHQWTGDNNSILIVLWELNEIMCPQTFYPSLAHGKHSTENVVILCCLSLWRHRASIPFIYVSVLSKHNPTAKYSDHKCIVWYIFPKCTKSHGLQPDKETELYQNSRNPSCLPPSHNPPNKWSY